MMIASTRPAAERQQTSDGRERIAIREAAPADNRSLLALTKVTPMAGKIALRIDREPDFSALLRARGTPIVYVATYLGEVIGCMSAAIHAAYISGALENVAYLGDLKVHPRYFGTRVGLRLIAALDVRLRAEGIDLCLSLIADGNKRAIHFTDGKHGVPGALHAGRFIVDQIIPSPFRPRSKRYRIDEARQEDLPEILELLDRTRRQRSFAPPVGLLDLLPRIGSTSYRRMLVVRDTAQIIASLTIEDTQDLRQNVLMGVSTPLGAALKVLQLMAFAAPGFAIPRVGGTIPTLYVRFMACRVGGEEALKLLVREARVAAFRQRFAFLSVGLHERDPLRSVVAGMPRMTFTSIAMASSLIARGRAKQITNEVAFEDFALV